MELLFLYLFSILRPILFININVEIGGLNLFEFAAIFLALLLFSMLIYKMGLKKKIYVSSVDLFILLFSLWCVGTFLAYSDSANVKEVAKMIIPLWTFVIVKNVITNKDQFKKLIFIMLIGFSIPVTLSVLLIVMDKGIYDVNYWTDIVRYRGIYSDPHNMGHNMGFLIMMVVTYFSFIACSNFDSIKDISTKKKIFIALLVVFAIFCLYKCWVRTAVIGLIVFFTVYLFFYNKKLLLIGTIVVVILGIIFAPVIVPRFLNDFQKVFEGEWDAGKLGSGRIKLWSNTLEGFWDLPLDKKLAGTGIGNKIGLSGRHLDTHNDILGLLEETGIVGFILYMLLQFFILKRILSLEEKEKYVFLAMFIAIFLMNLVSNSYISRFGIAQFYYLVMAYVDLPSFAKTAEPSYSSTKLKSNSSKKYIKT